MSGKLSGWDDTIVALATPQGIGAIGIIRISGTKAFAIVNKLFPAKDISVQASHTLHVGYLKDNDKLIDEVVLSLFINPRSYTGEDVIEISCHGSHFIQEKIMQVLVNGGARIAKPGEFTQRAFLNGKLDLTQAEAVADLIASNTEASRRTALNTMRGGFSETLKQLRDQLLQFSALIELELDFSQEDVEFADRTRFYKLLREASVKVKALLQSFRLGNVIKNGVQVAIIGKPNAGKSTLLNTLLNEDRAIVSAIAGTTRDTIEEMLNINGILFRLIDTAGIRKHTYDAIESFGVERSLEKMRQADVVLYLFDVNETGDDELQQTIKEMQAEKLKILLVGNKTDTYKLEKVSQKENINAPILYISAKEKENIDALKTSLYNIVIDAEIQPDDTIVTNTRHVDALMKIDESITEIIQGLDEKIPGDLIVPDIRRALYYLGEITGEVTSEDQLDYIFSKFCIGK